MQDESLNQSERALEQALARLTPLPPTGSGGGRDALLFAAGQRAARRKIRAWQGATGLLAVGWLATLMVWPHGLSWVSGTAGPDGGPRAEQGGGGGHEVVTNAARSGGDGGAGRSGSEVSARAASTDLIWESLWPRREMPLRPGASYLDLRAAVLARGVDAIPVPRGGGNVRDMLDEDMRAAEPQVKSMWPWGGSAKGGQL